ncbi:MAG: sulfatase [bacterium]|nr:sulfatase [bacterium]
MTHVLVALLVLLAACGRDPQALPETIAVEHTVAELSDQIGPEVVVAQDPTHPVVPAQLEPGSRLREGGGQRPSLVAWPGTRLRWRLAVPAHATLRFAVAVAGDGQKDAEKSGVRFRARVDGREAWSQVVDPAATRHDRRWFDVEVALGPAARTAEIELATEATDPSAPLAGTPGFGMVRVVRRDAVPRQPASAERPNVLVVLVDTLRADHVGVLGASPSPTPNLDVFAARGLVFEQAVAQSCWTLPSIATLFTGLHPRSHGATGAIGGGQDDGRWGFLSDRVTTLAELAAQAGITTFGVSSNPLVTRGTNLAQGFETFVEYGWDPKARNWPAAATVNAAALDWLGAHRDLRFFGYVHFMEPHDPYTPANPPPAPADVRPEVARGWVTDLATRITYKGAPGLTPPELAWVRKLYAAEVAEWDAAFGRLLAGLDALGLADRTVVIVTADHGEEFQEHGRLKHGTQLYEESIRVPLVIAGPGVAPGRVTSAAQGIDLLPTVAERLGLETPEDLPGANLLAAVPMRSAVSETSTAVGPDRKPMPLVALRTNRWKLIDAPSLPRRELYDLAADPGERHDQPQAPQGAALGEALATYAATAPPPPRADRAADPALRQKLKTLGYVE